MTDVSRSGGSNGSGGGSAGIAVYERLRKIIELELPPGTASTDLVLIEHLGLGWTWSVRTGRNGVIPLGTST